MRLRESSVIYRSPLKAETSKEAAGKWSMNSKSTSNDNRLCCAEMLCCCYYHHELSWQDSCRRVNQRLMNMNWVFCKSLLIVSVFQECQIYFVFLLVFVSFRHPWFKGQCTSCCRTTVQTFCGRDRAAGRGKR